MVGKKWRHCYKLEDVAFPLRKKKSSLGNPLANTVLVQVIKKFHSESILSKRQYDQVPSDASNDNFRKRLDFCDTLYKLDDSSFIGDKHCHLYVYSPYSLVVLIGWHCSLSGK